MQLKWWLKGAESRVRGWRAQLHGEARRKVRQLIRERSTDRPLPPGRWAWIDIASLDYDGPQGRLFYSVFIMLERAGFRIAIRPNQAFLSSFARRPIKALLLQRDFVLVADPVLLPEAYWWFTDRPEQRLQKTPAKTVHLLRHGPVACGANDFAMPFSLFPPHYESAADLTVAQYRDTPKRWRLFFGGGAVADAYDKPSGASLYGKVPRGRLLAALREHLGEERLLVVEDARSLARLQGAYFAGAVIVETSKLKVPAADWLRILAASECFLAAPGVNRPMSHNLIEAMAVGVPPLTEYGEYLFPSLRDGDNCLAYAGEQGFLQRVDELLAMPSASLQAMSERAAAYYDDYLRYDRFIARIAANPALRVTLHIAPHEQPISRSD